MENATKRKPPWFKFDVSRWRTGTAYLDNAERGAYFELLLYQFDKGFIPRKIIDRIASDEWDQISDKFDEIEPGIYINVKMAEERIIAFTNYYQRIRNLDGVELPSGVPGGIPTGVPVSSKSLLKDKEVIKVKRVKKKKEETGVPSGVPVGEPIRYPWDSEEFLNMWQRWKDYKFEQFKFKYKPVGEQTALVSLSKISQTPSDAIERLNRSIANGWKGFDFKDDRPIVDSRKKNQSPEVRKKDQSNFN